MSCTIDGILSRFDLPAFVSESLKTDVPRIKSQDHILCVFGIESESNLKDKKEVLEKLLSMSFDYRTLIDDRHFIGLFETEKSADVNKIAYDCRQELLPFFNKLYTCSFVTYSSSFDEIKKGINECIQKSKEQGTHFHKY